MVIVGIVVPIIRRTPRVVIICPPAGIDGRSAYKNGAHIVVRTIHIRRTDNLHIRRLVVHLCGQSCYVLENILRQHRLNNNHMVISIDRLYHTQIVHIPVTVQVQRRQHIRGRVEQHLELFQRVGLGKRSPHGTEVKEKTDVFAQRSDFYHSGSGFCWRRLDNRCCGDRMLHIRTAINDPRRRLLIHHGARFGGHCRGNNTCHTTAHTQCNCRTKEKKFRIFHILLYF